LKARDEKILGDVVFSANEISPYDLQTALGNKRYLEFIKGAEYWTKLFRRIPNHVAGTICPYMEKVLHSCDLDLDLKTKFVTHLIQKGHTTSSHGLILGNEIMRLILITLGVE
jgi:hypothetical protein